MTTRLACFLFLLVIAAPAARPRAEAPRVPTIDDLLTVKSAGGVQISPDGKWVAYTVTETDFKQDAYVTHLWIVNPASGRSLQLTRGEKGVGGLQWSPDAAWLAFTSNRIGDKNQIFVISPEGGEAVQLTKSESSIASFHWSHDGKRIAFSAADVPASAARDRKEQYGDFEVIRREYAHSHLWSFEVAEAMRGPVAGRQHTKGKDFSLGGFSWSPDGTRIAFSATINPDLVQGKTADIFVLNVATDAIEKIVALPGPDNNPQWSPDGRQIVFSSAMGVEAYFARNTRLAVVPAAGGTARSITDRFDENASFVEWNADGVYFSGLQKTASHLFRVDPRTGAIARVTSPDNLMANGFSLTADGTRLAFAASSPTTLNEVFIADMSSFAPRALTRMSEQAAAFTLGTREVVSWTSQDGATIEGVLIKPADFDPSRKYPLLCIIHGGPTGVDRPALLAPDTRYYPADIWAARGALILKVNYRGSAGYGEKFRQLNVRNLGVGDAWDVLSGIEMLVAKGWADPAKLACMGWSQGGYISAFLTTSSDRFKAISVGAGISDWATYYYNTDITPFTINYLGNNPVEDPDIYARTSPITYAKKARTPTLIQHGELDRRVPIANGYELRQALEDRGVPVEMVVYKGFGHGINKPRAMRAVMYHNLRWFNHYIFGDPPPDLGSLPLPQKTS
jgi:dipeptidyl aminopeptidase/acylaminoacyl peptidase